MNSGPHAAVHCLGGLFDSTTSCGRVDIDEAEYTRQMAMPDRLWQCPKCGNDADFDDYRFEQLERERQEHDDEEVPR